jgi:hypothetical protein
MKPVHVFINLEFFILFYTWYFYCINLVD